MLFIPFNFTNDLLYNKSYDKSHNVNKLLGSKTDAVYHL